jgi:hypothetical protein
VYSAARILSAYCSGDQQQKPNAHDLALKSLHPNESGKISHFSSSSFCLAPAVGALIDKLFHGL